VKAAKGDTAAHRISWHHVGRLGDHSVRQGTEDFAIDRRALLVLADEIRHEYGPEIVSTILWEVVLKTHGGLAQQFRQPICQNATALNPDLLSVLPVTATRCERVPPTL
jgi:hypothetical protein